MAKWKTTSVGSILKSKDESKPNYLKVNLKDKGTITLKHGQYLQVLSKTAKLKDIARLRREEKLSEDQLNKMEEYANKMPDFVLAEVMLVENSED